MPIYLFLCTKCGNDEERILCVAERDKDQVCTKCDYSMLRLQTPVRGIVKNPAVPKKVK